MCSIGQLRYTIVSCSSIHVERARNQLAMWNSQRDMVSFVRACWQILISNETLRWIYRRKGRNNIQRSEAHRRAGEEHRTRQGGNVYAEYNNDGSLGKSTCVLIGVWNREKKDICSKQWVAIDFCVQLGKDIIETCVSLRKAHVEECLVKRTIQHSTNPSAIDAKRQVIYCVPVGFAVWLRRSTNDQNAFQMENIILKNSQSWFLKAMLNNVSQ